MRRREKGANGENIPKGKGIPIIFLTFTFLLALLTGITQASSPTTVSVSIGNLTSAPSETITAPILISNVQNYGTGTISITYDPAVVHVTSVSEGPDSTVIAWNVDNTTGIVKTSAWNLNGASGDVIFANVDFKAVGNPRKTTSLKLNVTALKDTSYNDIPVSFTDGTFNIKSEGDTSTSPTPMPTETGEAKATPSHTPEGKTPGFESIFTCFALLVACLFLLRMRMRKRGGDSV